MSTETNKALILRWWDEVFNQHQYDLIDQFVARDGIMHTGYGQPPGPEGVRHFYMALQRAFPDGRITVQQMIAEDDIVAVRCRFSGTHRGVFMGIPPTGKSFSQLQIHLLRIVNDKIVEQWGVGDDFGQLRQLGFSFAPITDSRSYGDSFDIIHKKKVTIQGGLDILE